METNDLIREKRYAETGRNWRYFTNTIIPSITRNSRDVRRKNSKERESLRNEHSHPQNIIKEMISIGSSSW